MGSVEEKARIKARKKRRQGYVQLALLAALGTGALLVGSVTPKAFATLLDLPPLKRARLRYQARTVLGKLAVDGLVVFEQRDGKRYARITDAGRKILAFEQEKIKLGNRQRKWDRRWRMIVFDIPERRRVIRNRLRMTMEELGFMRRQGSVWVFPYDCEDFIALLKADMRIGTAVLYVIVEEIENGSHLREHFG